MKYIWTNGCFSTVKLGKMDVFNKRNLIFHPPPWLGVFKSREFSGICLFRSFESCIVWALWDCEDLGFVISTHRVLLVIYEVILCGPNDTGNWVLEFQWKDDWYFSPPGSDACHAWLVCENMGNVECHHLFNSCNQVRGNFTNKLHKLYKCNSVGWINVKSDLNTCVA